MSGDWVMRFPTRRVVLSLVPVMLGVSFLVIAVDSRWPVVVLMVLLGALVFCAWIQHIQMQSLLERLRADKEVLRGAEGD